MYRTVIIISLIDKVDRRKLEAVENALYDTLDILKNDLNIEDFRGVYLMDISDFTTQYNDDELAIGETFISYIQLNKKVKI